MDLKHVDYNGIEKGMHGKIEDMKRNTLTNAQYKKLPDSKLFKNKMKIKIRVPES